MNRKLGLILLVASTACSGGKTNAPSVQTASVDRRTIVIDAEATGVVEPINIVEVKSKASGLIVRMPVETGDQVKPGDLLVQVDTRDVQNQYNQSKADLDAAQAKLSVSESQKKRNDEMFKARVITAQEYETSALDFENSKASLIRAAANLDLAQQRLEDARVTAPVSGTIIEKSVSLGQVITSATSGPSGGTILLKMADLNQVRVRALFNETDIGQVRSGQQATVIVDAFPDHRFNGSVEKIEPQAVIQQNVTMFPVLITLDNREGLLKPGMNGEVSVLVQELDNVVAVPNDAIKTVREAVAVAPMLGLDPDSVQAQVRAQMTQGRGGRGGRGGNRGGTRGAGRTGASGGDVDLAAVQQQGTPQQGRRRRRPTTDPATTQPGAGSPPAVPQGGSELQLSRPENTGAPRRSRQGLVFIAENGTYSPRVVQLGQANFDYTEALSGLKEGEQVVLLTSLSLQAAREQATDRIRQRSGGLPGITPAGGGGGGRGGRGGR